MANRRLLLAPFERKWCSGHHQHALVCSEELSRTAQYTPKMQSLFVDAVQIAHDLYLVNRDPFHGHLYFPSVLVAKARGFDSDGSTIPRHPDGSIKRPPSGGLGCPAYADNVNMHPPSHDRGPRD
eukprot:1065192-Pyramimonas_sp.AAC.1